MKISSINLGKGFMYKKCKKLYWYILPVYLIAFSYIAPSHALTASEIISRARVNVKDQSSVNNRQQFTDATMLGFLNDGQREANILAWLLQDIYTLQLSSGTREYPLPNDFLSTDRVLHNDRKLEQTSLNQLDANSPGWLAATGTTPQKYYLYRTTNTVIGFSPKPYGIFTSTNVVIYYIKQPIELTSLSQTPWNGWQSLTPYHTALVYYVTYRASKVLEEMDMADKFYSEWATSIDAMRKGVYTMPDFNPGFTGQRK